MTKTVAVIGAGVAGPVVAMALQRAGIHAVLYEARQAAAPDLGAFITVQVNGLDALRAIGAKAVLDGVGFDTPTMRFRSGHGRYLGMAGTGLPLSDGTVGKTLLRAELYRALRDEALRRGIEIQSNRRFVVAIPTHDGVVATFEDGSKVRADVLIGADGVRSRVRAVIDPQSPSARYVPKLNLGGFSRARGLDAKPGDYEMIFGRSCFFGYVMAPNGEVWWFANPEYPNEPAPGELRAVTDAQWRQMLAEKLGKERGPALQIVEATPTPLFAWPTYDIPPIPRWHRERMIIIGDAAHATSPASGQGASMAIEDAVELGRCLRDLPKPEDAFAVYETLRRERVERVVALGNRWSSSKSPGLIGTMIRDAILPLMIRYHSGDGGASLSWMHHYHIDWDQPATDQVFAGVDHGVRTQLQAARR
jgi:FAD-dependent urate hydroxylase